MGVSDGGGTEWSEQQIRYFALEAHREDVQTGRLDRMHP